MDEPGSVLCPMGSFGIKSVESIRSDITVLDRCQTVILMRKRQNSNI